MILHHSIRSICFSEDHLIIEIDGIQRDYPLNSISEKLSGASQNERLIYEISPSGYGIHWPLLDEDISVDGLLGIVHRPKMEKMKASFEISKQGSSNK